MSIHFLALFSIFAIKLNPALITNDIDKIKSRFENKDPFSHKELLNLLKELYPTTNLNTLKWKIYDLKENGVIHPVAKGHYTFTVQKLPYQPEITLETADLYKRIRKELPHAELSIAHTTWFNEFMVHQVFRTYLIIEVEKGATTTVFNRLSEWGKRAFLNPTREVFEYYIANTEDPIIIKPLISESPLTELENIKAATLEKLLVDCVSDTVVYGAQHQEVSGIFESAMKKYALNLSKLKRYAGRRNKMEEINELLKKNMHYDR